MTRPACTIDSAWCDLAGVYLNGWAHLHETPVLSMRLSSGDSSVDLQRLLRPDVLAEFPDVPAGAACGFEAYLPCPPFRPVTLHLRTHYGAVDLDIKAGAEQTPQAGPEFQRAAPMDRFVAAMKASGGIVVEIGARVVGPASTLNAARFQPECRFVGTDVHAAAGVDLVVDAHALSQAMPPGSIDGVFSLAVMEHLAAPWVVAREINRVLRPGGLTLHLLPQAFPAHEQPNDFWRMSDDALRVLFGPASGFEVLEAGMSAPLQLVPAPSWRVPPFLTFPLSHAFAASFILARKVADVPNGAIAWPMPDMAAQSGAYPAHGAIQPPGPADLPAAIPVQDPVAEAAVRRLSVLVREQDRQIEALLQRLGAAP